MSDSASITRILGLPVLPSDTTQLADATVLTYDKVNRQFKFETAGGGGGTGTVTSVGLSVPVEFSVGGSPVTTAGTLAISKVNELANTVWAGPTSGGSAPPTFRALVSADIPGGGSPSFADEEVPSGVTPGTSFTLAHAPSPAASLQLFWNGLLQKPGGVDYTLAGTAITTVNTIGAGDSFLAWYRF